MTITTALQIVPEAVVFDIINSDRDSSLNIIKYHA